MIASAVRPPGVSPDVPAARVRARVGTKNLFESWHGLGLGLGLGLASLLGGGCYQGVDLGPGDSAPGDDAPGEETEGGHDEGGDTDGSPNDGDPQVASCDPTLAPPSLALRRLSRTQYQNTVEDLVAWAHGGPDASDLMEEIAPTLALMPDDVRRPAEGQHLGGFLGVDQAVQQLHIDASYRVGRAAAEA